MMKQEFAILKYGSRFNSLELMDEIFPTCCAIHNQRKVIAGTDMPWSSEERLDDGGDVFPRGPSADRQSQTELPIILLIFPRMSVPISLTCCSPITYTERKKTCYYLM